jgi:TonB family protein
MRLNSATHWLGLAVAMVCASVGAAEPQELPRCEKSIKFIHLEQAPVQTDHLPTGRVELEFTIDALGYVSDPVVLQSTAWRLNKEALKSAVLWRYAPPNSKCRHRTSITFELKDAQDAAR